MNDSISENRTSGYAVQLVSNPAAAEQSRPSPASAADTSSEGLLSPRYRLLTLGIVSVVAVDACEMLAIATVMPKVVTALDGVTLYGLAVGSSLAAAVLGMVAAGCWSDHQGPAPALRAGMILMILGLVMSGRANTMSGLLSGRVVSGYGAGMVSVAVYALIGRVYPRDLHGRVFAAFSTAWILPSLLAAALGGLIAERFGWRFVLLGLAVLAMASASLLRPVLRALPPVTASSTATSSTTARMAWACGASAAALMLHLAGQASFDRSDSGSSSTTLWVMLAALALLAVCAARLLPQGTLRARPGLPAVLALQGLAQASFFAGEAFLLLLLARERALSAAMAGAVLSVGALTWSAGASARAALSRRVSTATHLRIGMTLVAVGTGTSMLMLIPKVPVETAIAGLSPGSAWDSCHQHCRRLPFL